MYLCIYKPIRCSLMMTVCGLSGGQESATVVEGGGRGGGSTVLCKGQLCTLDQMKRTFRRVLFRIEYSIAEPPERAGKLCITKQVHSSAQVIPCSIPAHFVPPHSLSPSFSVCLYCAALLLSQSLRCPPTRFTTDTHNQLSHSATR